MNKIKKEARKLIANPEVEIPLVNPKDLKRVLILGNTIGFFAYPGEGCNISGIHKEYAKRFAWMYNCAFYGVELEILGGKEEFEYYKDLLNKIRNRYGLEAKAKFTLIKSDEGYACKLEQFVGKKSFDLVIANPPYGEIGHDITKKIIEEIDYTFFVNLLPENDWRRNEEDMLWQYIDIDSMRTLENVFSDYDATTTVCKVNKVRNTSLV